MSVDFLHSTTSAGTSLKVICGELIIDDMWNSHSEAFIACVREGAMTLEMTTSAYRLGKGDIFFISPNQKYKIDNYGNARVEVVLINLSGSTTATQEYALQNIVRGLTTGNCTHFAKIMSGDACYSGMLDSFNTIFESEEDKSEFSQLLVQSKMLEIFYALFSNEYVKICEVETQGKKYRALRRITDYINENFCENVTLDSIAETTGLSRYYVSHLFKELMNTTFVNYINELRLNRAAMLLTTTDTPVIEIAGLSGFNNISNFNRAFKMYYDVTPSKYRKNERQLF